MSKRDLETRVKEHFRNVRNEEITDSSTCMEGKTHDGSSTSTIKANTKQTANILI